MLKSGSGLCLPTGFNKLSTKPVVCRSGSPNRTFKVEQVKIAPSRNTCRRPRLPVCGRSKSYPDQTKSTSIRAALVGCLYEGSLLVLNFVGDQPLMNLDNFNELTRRGAH